MTIHVGGPDDRSIVPSGPRGDLLRTRRIDDEAATAAAAAVPPAHARMLVDIAPL